MTGPRPLVDALVRQELGRALGVARKRFIIATTSPRFIEDCWTRYEIGQREYGYEYAWLDWPDATFEGEAATEAMDFVVYDALHSSARVLRENWRRRH